MTNRTNRAVGRRVRSKSDKAEQTNLVRIIGQRMREAREMCNLNQVTAADRLGYKTSAKLSKIEGATENSVPLLVIAKAAKLYNVSTDYLMGVSEDWEIDAKHTIDREVSQWVGEAWEEARRRDLEVLVWLKHRVDAVSQTIPAICSASLRAQAAFERFLELNPDFEDMRGGNRLLMALGGVADSVSVAESSLKRYRVDTAALAGSSSQLSLFCEDV